MAFEPSRLLLSVIEAGRSFGLIGESTDVVIERSLAFADQLGEARSIVDLGSGGGVPGLILMEALPQATFVLVDSRQRRCDHLRRMIGRLQVTDRAAVECVRAEEFVTPERRGSYDAVVARSFGQPAFLVECAAPLLRVGGTLVVAASEQHPTRFATEAVDTVRLRFEGRHSDVEVLRQIAPCPPQFPRSRPFPPLF